MIEEVSDPMESEAAFLRARRQAIKDVANESSTCTALVPEEKFEGMWTDKHTAELNFQEAKVKGLKVEAYNDSTLLEEEVDSELEQDVLRQDIADQGKPSHHIKSRAALPRHFSHFCKPIVKEYWICFGGLEVLGPSRGGVPGRSWRLFGRCPPRRHQDGFRQPNGIHFPEAFWDHSRGFIVFC